MGSGSELRVYHWLVKENGIRSTKDVAAGLGISERTARRRLRRLYGHRYIKPAGSTDNGLHLWRVVPLEDVRVPTLYDCGQTLPIRRSYEQGQR